MVRDQVGDADCISMTVLLPIKQGLWGSGLWTIRFQKWTGQPKVLTWIPYKTCRMNQNTDFAPDPNGPHH
jgi:hypothetical protein